MRSIMYGERHRRRVAITVTAVLVPALAVGVWLLFFNSGGKQHLTVNKPAATQSVLAQTPTETPAVTPSETPSASVLSENTALPQKSADQNGWQLILVNSQHSLPDGFNVKLTDLKNGQSVDERCYPDLKKMLDDCRAAGLKPLVCSSYRSKEKQQTLFDNKVAKLKKQGLSDKEAQAEAAKVVAVPGTSEHQTGLALDIVDFNNQNLDETQENTPVQQWLTKNSWQYGFIIRYPSVKTEITGITDEPWHYRYVGKDAAKVIHDQGLCLEEYLSQLKK